MRQAACILLLALTSGCGSSTGSGIVPARFNGSYPIKVVCTTGMVADLVRNVGGPHVEVSFLITGDPHLYKATVSDQSTLNRADLVFYSGMGLEGKISDTLVRLAARKPTFPVTDGLPEERKREAGDGHYDPHVWFDVELWGLAAQHVGDVLAGFDPRHADDYRSRTAAYRAELARLHAECRQRLADIPRSQRVLVTAHDAFEYFGQAYDIEVRAVQGISTESEAGVKEVNDLVDFLTRRRIKAVFVESTVNPRNVQALVEGCRARGHAVEIGGELYSDALGEPGTPAGTYIGMVRHNVDTIVGALK
jgi:manganese/zinc/iron transport system substrate-binding protein